VLLLAAACGAAPPARTPLDPSPPIPPPASDEALGQRVAIALGLGSTALSLKPPPPTCTDVSATVSIQGRETDSSGTYAFAPSELTFKAGDCVEFTFTSQRELHTFTVDDLGIDKTIEAGETATFTFVLDKPGAFRLICVPHELQGMTGTITVQ
jgi:plastocyanin